MKLTYYGHSTFLIHTGGKSLVFDPFISPNPLAAAFKINEIKADYILLFIGHGYHVADAESMAEYNCAYVVSSYEI